MRSGMGAVLVLIIVSASSATMAQQIPPETGQATAPTAETLANLSPDERMALLSRLSDEQARALLSEYLISGSSGAPTAGSMSSTIEMMETESAVFQQKFAAMLHSAPQLGQIPTLVYDQLTRDRSSLHPLLVLGFLVVVLGIGYGVERAIMRTTTTLRLRLSAIPAEIDFLGRFGRITGLLMLDMLGLVLFAVTGLLLFLIANQGHEPTRLVVLFAVSAVVFFRFVVIVSRATFGSGDVPLQLVPFNADDARLAHRYVVAAGGIGVFGFLGCDLLRMFGLDEAPSALLTAFAGTLFMVAVFIGIWRVRNSVAEAILSRLAIDTSPSGPLAAIVRLWHLPVLAYIVAVYFMALFNGLLGNVSGSNAAVASILLIALVPLIDRVLCSAIDRFFGTDAAGGDNSVRALHRSMHILVILLAVVVVAAIWRADIFGAAGTGVGGRIARAVLDIALTGFVGYVAWALLYAAVSHHLPDESDAAAHSDEGGGAATTRAGTVLPLVMRFAQVTIAVIVVMVALSALGVNIGPLLAGAGIVGIAVGFGAQTLVRDLVSGLFFLIDDAFRRGEYVDIGGIRGTVETINVRSMVLRHHLGPLHTVPYGEIQHLTNYSRDWVIMKLEFRVSYDTDPNKVKKIFRQIGQEMLEHPELGRNFIEPFKSQGVKAMEESAMIIRGKFMAKPGTQFTIRKELYNRVQKAFQENGIEFAHRRVMVDLPQDVDLTPEKKKEIAEAAAAGAVLEDKQREPAGG